MLIENSDFLEARHQLDEIARAVAAVQLLGEDAVPSVFDRSVGAGQGEDVGAPCDNRQSARLDGAGADGLEAEPAEQFAKAGNVFAIVCGFDLVERFGCDISASQARAASADNCINAGVFDPSADLLSKHRRVVFDNQSVRDVVTSVTSACFQNVTRRVRFRSAGVGNGQNGDVDRFEGPVSINRHLACSLSFEPC